jgi:hypothetical protein
MLFDAICMFLLKETSFVGFSFESYSEDDEYQPQISLFHQFCTYTFDSSIAVLLPR